MRNRPEHSDAPVALTSWEERPEDTLPEDAGTRSRLRRLGPTGVWPTLFTLGNLVSGFAAIYCATRPLDAAGFWGWTSLTMACALILLGILLDSVDGSVARLTGGVTELGGQLDALADLITCGVAPAFVMLHVVSHGLGIEEGASIFNPGTGNVLGRICWGIAALFVCCAALRLARFTVETSAGRLGDHMTHHMQHDEGWCNAARDQVGQCIKLTSEFRHPTSQSSHGSINAVEEDSKKDQGACHGQARPAPESGSIEWACCTVDRRKA